MKLHKLRLSAYSTAAMRKLFFSLFSLSVSLLSGISQAKAKYKWPSIQYENLETLLYEGVDMIGLPIGQLAEGCKKRDPNAFTSTVAAEWLRFVRDLSFSMMQ